MEAKQVARVVHEANRALQIEQADPAIPVSPSWDELDDETKLSAIEGVFGAFNGNTPEESHVQWCAFKEAHGWVYGPVKDDVAKTHPLLVPYADLPESQKIKDNLFVAIAETLK